MDTRASRSKKNPFRSTTPRPFLLRLNSLHFNLGSICIWRLFRKFGDDIVCGGRQRSQNTSPTESSRW
jgi:hypothetical protein